MKIKEYPKATEISKTDAFVIETSGGTKYIESELIVPDQSLTQTVITNNVTLKDSFNDNFTITSARGAKFGGFKFLYINLTSKAAVPAGTWLQSIIIPQEWSPSFYKVSAVESGQVLATANFSGTTISARTASDLPKSRAMAFMFGPYV